MRIMNKWSSGDLDDSVSPPLSLSHTHTICIIEQFLTHRIRNVNGWHKSHKTQWSYYARVHFETIQNDTIKSCKHNMRIGLKKNKNWYIKEKQNETGRRQSQRTIECNPVKQRWLRHISLYYIYKKKQVRLTYATERAYTFRFTTKCLAISLSCSEWGKRPP